MKQTHRGKVARSKKQNKQVSSFKKEYIELLERKKITAIEVCCIIDQFNRLNIAKKRSSDVENM